MTFPRRICTLSKTALATVIASALYFTPAVTAQSGLQVTYGAKGVQKLSYNGITLEDTNAFPSDTFHIWHMKSSDLSGNPVQTGQYGWGESNNGTSWNPQTLTETYYFVWGSIATQFVQSGNNLDMIVTETNNAGSGIAFDGAEVYPFFLHFPQDPANFYGYSQYAITTTGPGVSVADFGSGIVTSVIPTESFPMYGGWKNAGSATYSPLMVTTAPDGLATFLPRNDNPVQPGTSFSYRVSLRFTNEGVPANASDAYASFAQTYPNQLNWPDRRIIGTAYLSSSSGSSNINTPSGYPTNPRRYFNDPSVDITNPAGLQAFQSRMLAQAAENASTAAAMNAQGVVTWDIEGEEYSQNTSYVCSPDQIATVAPEMVSTISLPNSPYNGMRLVDAYFKVMSSTGIRTGVCLRPQVFAIDSNGNAAQSFLSTNAAIIANLENKARYAFNTWGTTLFYVDSTVDVNGGTLDPAIFQQIATDLPNFLFIPEESTPRYYAYTAPFYSFIFHTALGTDPSTYNYYPHAFGANLVNDVSAATLAQYTPQLTHQVSEGDILMGHADYWQANDPTLVSIYAAAGSHPINPAPTAPVISWPVPAGLTYGQPLTLAQLDASASVPGTFTYNPASGTLLHAGTNSLTATFVPSNTTLYTSVTATNTINVAKATPVLSWATPASIVNPAPLTATQLNATASVPGTFTYSPAAGTVLPAGTTRLQVTFTPTDAADYNAASASTNLTVTAQPRVTPSISWPSPASILSGAALTSAQLDATASVPGTFQYSPATGTVLPVGTTTLSVTFTPADTVHYTTAAATTTLTVNPRPRSTPSLTWPTPASIVSGSALTSAQLDAVASVAGTFQYSPAAGSVLPVGSNTLTVTFTPTDSTDYTTASASVVLTVNPRPRSTPSLTWPAPASIVSGSALTSAQLDAVASIAGTFQYSPAAGSVLPVGSNTLTVTFTPTDSADYTTASASVILTVTPRPRSTPSLTWPAPASIVSGTALTSAQLNAVASVAGTFQYSPAVGSVLPVGSNTLTVTFTPADSADYTTASASVELTVAPVVRSTPALSWPTPAPITYGVGLSAAQLDATASVPGTFLYSSVPGAVLPVGTNTLTVTFTPIDTTHYTSASASVALTVNPLPVSNLAILSPTAGATVSGFIQVQGYVNLFLDAAGSFLIVDGIWYDQHRVTQPPYLYGLDTTALSNGQHTLQLWGHDIGNNTTYSAPITITVAN